jgi:hypothetical protein
MALLSTAGETQALQSLDASAVGSNLLLWVSLHVSPGPSTTGANENPSTGGYVRITNTWTASSGGSARTNVSGMTFSTAGVTAVTHLGTFSASSAGTFGIGLPLGSSVTAASITVASGAASLTAT